MVSSLNYGDVRFQVSKRDYKKIDRKNNICINVFGYENGLAYPIHVSHKKFED